MSEVKGFKLIYCDRPARFEVHDMNGGMCSYCYEGNGGAETMAFKFLQAAQSELSALREELASAYQSFDKLADIVGFSEERLQQTGDSPMDCAIQLKQCLADAEWRNESLSSLLREGLEESKEGDDWIDRVVAALTKPEEAKS